MNWAVNNPFRDQPPQNTTQQNQGPQGQGNQSFQNPPNNQGDPNNPPKKQGGEGDDPMADLKSLWEPNKDDKGQPIKEDNTPKSFMPKLDEKALMEKVEQMDFTKGLTAEEMDAIKEGGDKAVGAFANMLNRAGRRSFLTAFQASSKMAEQGFTQAQERFMESLGPRMREMMIDQGLGEDLSIVDNPMFKPQVDNVKAQILKKFPRATPQQVRSYIKQYFEALKTELTKTKQKDDPNAEQSKLRNGSQDADFESWLGDELLNAPGMGMFGGRKETELDQE